MPFALAKFTENFANILKKAKNFEKTIEKAKKVCYNIGMHNRVEADAF